MERVQGKKRRLHRLLCEGPAEPSDTSSGHSSAVKRHHNNKTVFQGNEHGVSERSQTHKMSSSEAAGENGLVKERKRKTG